MNLPDNPSSFPLAWPAGQPRTAKRQDGRMRTSYLVAIGNVVGSLERLAKSMNAKLEEAAISSNVRLGNMSPLDPGIAVWFRLDGAQTCIAIDYYKSAEDNMQAIHHCLEAELTKIRHGGLNMVKLAMQGTALVLQASEAPKQEAPPPAKASPRTWMAILGLDRTASRQQVEAAFREKAKTAHPDRGGNKNMFALVVAARDKALERIGG